MSGYGSKVMESIRLYMQVPWYNIRCLLGYQEVTHTIQAPLRRTSASETLSQLLHRKVDSLTMA